MELVIIRGLPGSGKSTLAKTMMGYEHYEADMFFMVDGVYIYAASKIRDAHDWCFSNVEKDLIAGKNVVVSNTFTRRFEMERYLNLCTTLAITPVIIECKGTWANTHNVPEEAIARMRDRWEAISV